MRLSLLVALIVLVGLVAAPRAQDSVDGKWALTFDTPMGSLDASATFETQGEELTGTMESQAGSTQLKGSARGNTIDFVMNVSMPEGEFSVHITGERDGDSLKGTFDFGQGAGSWTGKRIK